MKQPKAFEAIAAFVCFVGIVALIVGFVLF